MPPHARLTRSLFRSPRRQRGVALMVMLVIMVTGIAALLVGSFSLSGLQVARDLKTAEALAQAKDALIGETTDVDLASHHYPGSLPCPDTDNDGTSDAGGSTECPQYIGRLPWKTLGLPDLRDASGERLWYTLSRNVRRYDAVRPLNSNVTGTLNITGTHSASSLVAIVFAPGATLSDQRRSTSQTAACPTTGDTRAESLCAANYLEGSNADPSPGAAPNQDYQSSDASLPFNDKLVWISHDQLFQPVEKRVGNEIRKILDTYRAAWGAYPFAAPFADPAASSFIGSAAPATHDGLLPVNDQSYLPTWAATPSISFSGGSPSPSMSCMLRDGGATGSRWRCCNIDWWDPSNCTGATVTIPSGATVTITGTLRNVGRGFWRPHHLGNICEVRARNAWDNSVLATSLFAPGSASVTGSLNPDGSATVVFRATGKSGGTTLKRIELRDIQSYNTDIKTYTDSSTCPATSSASPVIPQWLFDDTTSGNNWHQVAYYAVSGEHAPGGDHTCTTSPCLTVNGAGGGSDRHAVVVMTGSALAGQTRSSGNIANYLEGENVTPADSVYENKARSSTFNDQVIVVAP